MTACPHCHQVAGQNKAGFTRFGSQRYFCTRCRCTYTPTCKPQGHPTALRQEAVRYSPEGLSQRKVARLLHVSAQSVANWLAKGAATLEERRVPLVSPELAQHADGIMEQDDLYTFCGAEREKKGAI